MGGFLFFTGSLVHLPVLLDVLAVLVFSQLRYRPLVPPVIAGTSKALRPAELCDLVRLPRIPGKRGNL